MSAPLGANLNLEVGQRYLIGRDARCTIVLDDPSVAPFHAEMIKLSHRTYLVRDLGSEQGTVVRRDQVYLARIHRDEEIRFGSALLSMRELENGQLGGQTKPESLRECYQLLSEHSYEIGASPECDIVVPSTAVGWVHGTLRHRATGWTLVPRGGGPTVSLSGGTSIHLGSHLFEIDDGHRLTQREFVDNRLDVRDLVFETRAGKRLLNRVSFSALSGQVIGIMGPSGAGKSVLLRTICGVFPATSGDVYLFRTNTRNSPELLRSTLAYVPQDDLVMPELTVFENVRSAARLKLPRDWPPDEVTDYVDDLLARLGLSEAQNTLGGLISGGQRKRVQLAMELVTDPAFLVADEPCSGLSSWDSSNVVSMLRSMADAGRTVLFTVHSPDIDVLEKMDRLLLLDRGGELAYFGPAYPNAMQYFARRVVGPTESPKLIFDELERRTATPDGALVRERSPEDWRDAFAASSQYVAFVQRPQEWIDRGVPGEGAVSVPARRPNALWRGLTLLRRRALRQLRDRQDLFVTLAQGPLIALLFFVVFLVVGSVDEIAIPLQAYGIMRGQQAIVFLAVITAVWFGASRGVVELPSSWSTFDYERLSFLRPGTFVVPRFVVLAIVVLLQVGLFGGTLSLLYLVGPAIWHPDYFAGSAGGVFSAVSQASLAGLAFTGVLALTGVAALSTAMFLGSLVGSRRSAVAMLPMLLVVQSLLAGYQPPLDQMWTPVRAAAEAMASLHGFEAATMVLERFAWADFDPRLGEIDADSFTTQVVAAPRKDMIEALFPDRDDPALDPVRVELGRSAEGIRPYDLAKRVLDEAKWAQSLGPATEALYERLITEDPQLARFRYPRLPRVLVDQIALAGLFLLLTIASVAASSRMSTRR